MVDEAAFAVAEVRDGGIGWFSASGDRRRRTWPYLWAHDIVSRQ